VKFTSSPERRDAMSLTTRVRDSVVRRAGVVGGATLAAGAVWLLAHGLGADLVVDMAGKPPQVVGFPIALAFAAQAALAGWALLAILERVSRHARPAWLTVAAVVLAASFVPVFAVEATVGTRASLTAMHLAVGVVLMAGLPPKPSGTRATEASR
jgi:hypothetical protein